MYYPYIGKSALLLAAAFCCSFVSNAAIAHGDDDDGHGIITKTVNCAQNNASVQMAIDGVRHGTKATIFIQGWYL